MSPEETARLHADRPGYELIDFAEVGLPVFKIYVVASLLLHTPLPPIFEFVLRCIRLGINDRNRLSGCLGLPVRMVDQALRSLHAAEEITFVPTAPADAEAFALTRRGERTATSLERVLPELQTLPIYFDGLTRVPIAPPAAELLPGRQAAERGLIEIPALPATRVEVDDIDVSSAARLLSRDRATEPRRDLLAIRSIDRRMRLQLPATALVFRAVGSDDIEIAFATGAILLDRHNRAFAVADGPKRSRLLRELAKPDQIGSNSFARRLATLDRQVDDAEPRTKASTLTLSTRGRVAYAPGTLRRLLVQDHPPLLHDAVRGATDRLLIVCPWITSQVVDGALLADLETMLGRDVSFYLGYGLDEGKNKPTRPIPLRLEELAVAYPNFHLKRIGNTHEKVLIKDHQYAVLTSFNWLSFKGDPNRPMRRERGVMISEAQYVDDEFSSFAELFEERKVRRPRTAKRAVAPGRSR